MTEFDPLSRLVEYLEATLSRMVVFGVISVVGWAVYRAPTAFGRAVSDGIDVRTLVDLTVGAPGAGTVALAAVTAAVVWPAFFPDHEEAKRERRRQEPRGDGNGGVFGSLIDAGFRHRGRGGAGYAAAGGALGSVFQKGIVDLPNPFAIVYRIVRFFLHTWIRLVVFLAVGLSTLTWYERPGAFADATDGGVDVLALVFAATDAPSFLPALGVILVASVVWPLVIAGGSNRYRNRAGADRR